MSIRHLAIKMILAGLAVLAAVSPAQAQQRRVQGQTVDNEDKPLAGVSLTITSPVQKNFIKKMSSDKDGKFTLMVMETVDQLEIKAEKDGYETKLTAVRPTLGSTAVALTLRKLSAEETLWSGPEGKEAQESFQKGVEATKSKDWPAAREAFAKAAKIRPQLFEAWVNLATTDYNLKAYEETIATAQKVLEMKPEFAPANKLIADSYLMLGQKDKAEPFLKKVAEGDPKLAADIAFNEAAELVNAGKDPEAKLKFEAALQAQPNFPEAHYELGLLDFRQGDKAGAREHLLKFTELDPSNAKVGVAQALIAELDKSK